MRSLKGVSLIAGVTFCFASTALAQAGSPSKVDEANYVGDWGGAQFFAGLRLWANEWDIIFLERKPIIDPKNPTTILLQDQISSHISKMKIVPMPTMGVRYGSYVASMTYSAPTSYDASSGYGRSVERSEFDVNFGYLITSSVLMSLGFKTASVDRLVPSDSQDSKQRIQAIVFGVSGNAPIADPVSLYGNMAYGMARQKSAMKDASGDDTISASYVIGEFGVSVRLLEGEAGAALKQLTGSVGYRVQTYTNKDVPLGTYTLTDPMTPVSVSHTDMRNSTSGIVLSIVGAF